MLREVKTLSQSLILGTAFAMLLPLWAYAQTPNDIARQALDLASNDDYASALALMDSQSVDIRDSYDVQSAKARILAWSGEHKASTEIYKNLLATYPGNADILNGYAYLEYYRENLRTAESYFREVLADHPKYEDAQRGLERVLEARAAKRENTHRWRIDLNAGLYSFDNGLNDWNQQSLRVEHTRGDVAIYGSAARFERFGLNDLQFFGGIRSDNDSKFDWNIGAGFTPDADFRAELTGLARLGYKFKMDNGTVLHTSIGYQLDDYAVTGNIHQLSPQIMAYFENGVILTGRAIHVMQSGVSDQTGFLVSGFAPVTDRLGARAGYANAPETVGGVVIDTESIFGGLAYKVSDQTEIHGTYSRDDRENTFISDGVNFGITQKY